MADLHSKISISCSFSENLTKPYVSAPRGLAPPPRGNPGSTTGCCVNIHIKGTYEWLNVEKSKIILWKTSNGTLIAIAKLIGLVDLQNFRFYSTTRRWNRHFQNWLIWNLLRPSWNLTQLTVCLWPLNTLVQSPNSVTQARPVWSELPVYMILLITWNKNKAMKRGKKISMSEGGEGSRKLGFDFLITLFLHLHHWMEDIISNNRKTGMNVVTLVNRF